MPPVRQSTGEKAFSGVLPPKQQSTWKYAFLDPMLPKRQSIGKYWFWEAMLPRRRQITGKSIFLKTRPPKRQSIRKHGLWDMMPPRRQSTVKCALLRGGSSQTAKYRERYIFGGDASQTVKYGGRCVLGHGAQFCVGPMAVVKGGVDAKDAMILAVTMFMASNVACFPGGRVLAQTLFYWCIFKVASNEDAK